MGIIGFGRIGQKTGTIAKALGMRILAFSPHESETGRKIGEYVDLDTLLAESDVISLHCPLFPETREIINRETIAKMKDGVILLNNSRGPLINEQDLADALNSGHLAGAALDVVVPEPLPQDHPLWDARNLLLTPHVSGNLTLGYTCDRAVQLFCQDLLNYAEGRPLAALVDRTRGY